MSDFVRCALRFASVAFLLFAVCAAPCLVPVPCTAEEVPFSPYVETHPDGRIDWDEGVVYGVGKGYVHMNQGSRAKALRAARALALQSILKVAAGVHLDDRETLESLDASGRVEIQLSALVRYEEHETVWMEEGDGPHARVTYRAPLKGVEGLTRRLITHLRETPSAWDRFPLEAQVPPAPPATDLPWVVVDARDLPQDEGVRPALFPQIKSTTGETIYDLGSVREAALVERGMARYVNLSRAHDELLASGPTFLSRLRSLFKTRGAWAQESRNRAKRGRFVITDATRAQGLSKTNLVISDEDARKIRDEDASSNILKDCRVIVIVSGTVGGIEGQLLVPEKAFTGVFGFRRL
ncbi:MAG: hypothetical protein ACQET7_08565 [Thermodesulfobacteriota bacterium]